MVLGPIGPVTFLSGPVKIDVKINEWFGEFYDMIQKALATPNAVTIGEYWASLFAHISRYICCNSSFSKLLYCTLHSCWRTAMVEWHHSVYDKARTIEGTTKGTRRHY